MPKKLDARRYRKAMEFIRLHARPLEQALANFKLENGPLAPVLAELSGFQNEDGGFWGLEPDLRTRNSTAIATSICLQTCLELRLDPSEKMLKRTLDYLAATIDRQSLSWPAVTKKANDAPHAPWWTFNDAEGKSAAGSPVNPSAQLAAAFLKFGDIHLYPWQDELIQRLIQHLDQLPDAMEFHDLMSYLELYKVLPPASQQKVEPKLKRAAQAIVTRNPADWGGYAVKPLWLAPTPDSLVRSELGNLIDLNLDYEIAAQGDDGSWAPNWSWFGNYPETWPVAEREWRGVLTLRVLSQLSAYGRIER